MKNFLFKKNLLSITGITHCFLLKLPLICFLFLLQLTKFVHADDPSENSRTKASTSLLPTSEQLKTFWDRSQDNILKSWDSGRYEIFVPFYAWHNRLLYDDRTDDYNEFSAGIGFGKVRYDHNGNWHSLYAMGFEDSNHKFEPIIGYGYERIWGDEYGWHAGMGFTAGATSRYETNYIPIPVLLPLASIGFKEFTVQATYVPGFYNSGNILFAWLRINTN